MNKRAIIESLKDQLRARYERTLSALAGATEAATGDDTKAEGKYDTRGLEASYLAAGQAEQADELAEALALVEAFDFPEFDLDDPIESGALVEADLNDEVLYFLLAPAGGGLTIETEDDISVTVLGPSAPLRTSMMGKTTGGSIEESGMLILEVM